MWIRFLKEKYANQFSQEELDHLPELSRQFAIKDVLPWPLKLLWGEIFLFFGPSVVLKLFAKIKSDLSIAGGGSGLYYKHKSVMSYLQKWYAEYQAILIMAKLSEVVDQTPKNHEKIVTLLKNYYLYTIDEPEQRRRLDILKSRIAYSPKGRYTKRLLRYK